MDTQFIDQRILIGQGKMAKVYLWNGFAYKCFEENYPETWLTYEMNIQNSINKCQLPTVKYYESEFSNSIKMGYIDGIVLTDRMRIEKYKQGVDDLINLFNEVHLIREIDLPSLNPYLMKEISTLDIEEEMKLAAQRFIAEIPDDQVLCHLDFHFSNLMFSNNQYTIIDWINAKLGNPIYDFARTYVIMYEFAFRLSKKFLTRVLKECAFTESDFNKALYVMAMHRLTETNSDKVKELLVALGNQCVIQSI